MGLLGNVKAHVNVRVHFGIICIFALAVGGAVQIWGPPGSLAEFTAYAKWIIPALALERVLTKEKKGGK